MFKNGVQRFYNDLQCCTMMCNLVQYYTVTYNVVNWCTNLKMMYNVQCCTKILEYLRQLLKTSWGWAVPSSAPASCQLASVVAPSCSSIDISLDLLTLPSSVPVGQLSASPFGNWDYSYNQYDTHPPGQVYLSHF